MYFGARTVACVPVNLAAELTQSLSSQVLASIPSPSVAVWKVGPIPIRAYALCIILGIIAAAVISDYRMRRRGAPRWAILDIAVYAVPFGIIGGRIYHVITSPEAYFGEGGEPIKALYIWEGGLGIWGAIALGALGAWLACKQMGLPLPLVADAMAVGLPVGQAIGRLGNWFNNELYGGPTSAPWGLEVHKMDPNNQGHALVGPDGKPVLLEGLYQPTFLYELIWNLLVAVFVYLADRRFKFGRGRAFALYVMAYTAGRGVIETIRTDEANHFFGVRLNVWTSAVVFLAALVFFLLRKGPQEFVIPAAEGGKGFQVVTEAEYDEFVASGARPDADSPADPSNAAEADESPDDTKSPDDAESPGDVEQAKEQDAKQEEEQKG
ncbi:MAG: prolipoprotein diacylglyceryl transferase [Hamadaea sp.]|nr:prolipoprotein diacylglyceryl transferase [Hamadaea sp.]NUR51867.1 prolipoprotein diacylglyceryl transferase [Hamadaea sp.]NUT03908.1 prolipoprotein diacylglyceryl transferase [Hamadaea sp.]